MIKMNNKNFCHFVISFTLKTQKMPFLLLLKLLYEKKEESEDESSGGADFSSFFDENETNEKHLRFVFRDSELGLLLRISYNKETSHGLAAEVSLNIIESQCIRMYTASIAFKGVIDLKERNRDVTLRAS